MRKEGSVTRTFTFQGKRYYISGKTEKEALLKMAKKKTELEKNIITVSSSMTLLQWARICVDTYKTNQKEITRKKYEYRMNHCILDKIGWMKLTAIKQLDLQQILNDLNGQSKTQINEVYQQLQLLFGKAFENKLIQENIALYLIKPKGYKNKRREITEAERTALIKAAEKDQRFDMFLFMLYAGCRPSEAQHLKYEDIQEINGKPVLMIRGTKTENAKRMVPLKKELYDKYRKKKKGYIFTTSNGKTYTDSNYKNLCNALYREMDLLLGAKTYRNHIYESVLAEDFCPYVLRHSFACDCARRKIDIRTTAKMLGHSSIQITNDIYTHIGDDMILQVDLD